MPQAAANPLGSSPDVDGMSVPTMNRTYVNGTKSNPTGHHAINYWYHTTANTLSLVTVLGSSLVIFLILTRPRLRNKTNMFVLSLMVADFFIGVFIPPIDTVCRFSFESWCKNKVLKKVFFNFLLSSSITNLCAMTIERYIFVVLPLQYPIYMTASRAAVAIVSAWVLALVVHIVPVWSYVETVHVNRGITHGFILFRICVFAIVPSVILALAFLNIYVIARKIIRQVASQKAQLDFNSRSITGAQAQDLELSLSQYKDRNTSIIEQDNANTFNGTRTARTETMLTTTTFGEQSTADQADHRSSSPVQANVNEMAQRANSIVLSFRSSVSFNPNSQVGRKARSNSTSLQRTVKVIGLVILLHEFCWSMTIYIAFCYDFRFMNVCQTISNSDWTPYLSMLLLFANSAANPIVYALMKKDIREEFGKLFKCTR